MHETGNYLQPCYVLCTRISHSLSGNKPSFYPEIIASTWQDFAVAEGIGPGNDVTERSDKILDQQSTVHKHLSGARFRDQAAISKTLTSALYS